VTVLPPSADAMLLLGQRVKLLDKDDEDAATVLAEVRRQAARFPGDTLAGLILARAELTVGDAAAGEQAANAVLERDPDNVEAMQLLAEHDLEAAYASDDNDERTRLMVRAQRHLGRAFQIDGENYLTFMLLARLRSGQSGYPNDNDLATLEFAHALAPQLPDTVLNLASVLIETGQQDRAVGLLEPLANSPHGGGGASAARAMINEVKGITAEQDDASEGEAEPEGD
jgi:cytochrome c-type biogenesis protein CcmH/NrfG